MRGGKHQAESIRLKGFPQDVSGLVPMPPGGPGWVKVTLDLPGERGRTSLVGVAVPSGLDDVARLLLTLGRTTPAGTYEGEVWLGSAARPLTVEVEPHASLGVHPQTLILDIGAQATPAVEVTVLNLGNVGAEILSGYVFGLVDSKGLDRALSRTSGAKITRNEGRADYFFGEVAQGRGGPVRVEVGQGSGKLAPGEARDVRAKLRLPDRLHSGRTYSGVWRLEDAALSIRVNVNGGERSAEEIA